MVLDNSESLDLSLRDSSIVSNIENVVIPSIDINPHIINTTESGNSNENIVRIC